MTFSKNSIFTTLIVVFAISLIGVPKIQLIKDKVNSQNQQLIALTQEIKDLQKKQHKQSLNLQRKNASFETKRKLDSILSPVFQINGNSAVGSAVLVNRFVEEDEQYYLALSCYHVIRDILAEQDSEDIESIFEQGRETPLHLQARLIAHDADLDLALIKIKYDKKLAPVAKLAPISRANDIQTFSEIYTVGSPLGTPVQGTSGEISRKDWKMEREDYWMISAPAYFGNSGGGVFLAETYELIGIFSKIYTHGSFQPQVITHMGLAIPLDVIHNWLNSIGFNINNTT